MSSKPLTTLTKCVLTVVDNGERHFDVVTTLAGDEVGRLEGDYVTDLVRGRYFDRFVIGNCGVQRRYRRRGIATAMVLIAFDEARRRFGTDETRIIASAHDGARADAVEAFWRGLGFVPGRRVTRGAIRGVRMMRRGTASVDGEVPGGRPGVARSPRAHEPYEERGIAGETIVSANG